MSHPSPQLQVVLTTVSTADDAGRMARALVERQLVACAQIVPGLTSVYRWQGEICEDHELLLVLKTSPSTVPSLRQAMLELHPYDTPQFVALDATASEDYLAWALAQLAPGD